MSFDLLNDYQKNIFKECISKGSGGLSLPKGSGKTLLSLVISLNQTKNPILILCSKSLIGHWVSEINKFFEDTLNVETVHSSYIKNINQWKIKEDTQIVITTPDLIRNIYSKLDLGSHLITQKFVIHAYVNFYHCPRNPILHSNIGIASLYSIKWGCIILDESQNHLNILSKKGRALCLLSWDHLWLTSGDLHPDGKLNKVFCYYLMLRLECPDNIPDFTSYIKNGNFNLNGGLKTTMVHRFTNEAFINKPKLHHIILDHSMCKEEKLIYTMFRNLVKQFDDKIKQIKNVRAHTGNLHNNDDLVRFSSGLRAMISHLRQSLVSPILPIANSIIKISEVNEKNEIATVINQSVRELGIYSWLDSEECVKSSRIKKVLEKLNELSNKQVIIFSAYRTSINILNHFITDRECFNVHSSMNAKRREIEINNFKASTDGVLLLTYAIGSVGLNLQSCHQVILIDYEWSSHITSQAICRLYRMGQKSEDVYVYYLTANTGIEKCILNKQLQKKKMADDMFYGRVITIPTKFKIADMVKMVLTEDNITLLNEIYI
uniref:DEAD/SNF2-like helicase n=1 Tax=Pithovirus LCPAC101 TaxID=2506586 RepID=A0A481Z4G4_9VIRU|nr:MAG: DEAD/SNF2-like helicase [Pithovirus LCPAC101]